MFLKNIFVKKDFKASLNIKEKCQSISCRIIYHLDKSLGSNIINGAELGGATGAMAPLGFWSRSLKKSRKVSKSKSCSLEWHQLFLPSFGANGDTATTTVLFCYNKKPNDFPILKVESLYFP